MKLLDVVQRKEKQTLLILLILPFRNTLYFKKKKKAEINAQDHHHRPSSFKIHSVAIQTAPEGDGWFKECENQINK